MAAWSEQYISLIYQIQAIAFVVLGVVSLTVPRYGPVNQFRPDLWLLSGFAFTHAAAILIGSQVLEHAQAAWPGALRAALLPASYLFLLEFGRRIFNTSHGGHTVIAWWSPCLVVGLAWAALLTQTGVSSDGLAAAARIAVGLPAALLTAWAALRIGSAPVGLPSGRMRAQVLRIAAIAFIVYGLLIPVLPVAVPGLPGWWPTEADLAALTGWPTRGWRALMITVVAAAILVIARDASASSSSDLERLLGSLNGFIYRVYNAPDWPARYLAGNVREMTGYTSTELLTGRTTDGRPLSLADVVHPDDRARCWEETQQALAEGRDYRIEYRPAGCPDEAQRWYFDHGRGVFNDRGQLLFLEGHTVDITALRQADKSLQRSKERLEQAERMGRLGHWELDLKTGRYFWSAQLFRLFGFTPAEQPPPRETWLERLHPEDGQIVREDLRLMEEQVIPPARLIRTHPERGPMRYMSYSATLTPAPDGQPRYVSGTLLDVTEIQIALNELRRTEEQHREARDTAMRERGRLKALLAGMSIGILFEDRSGRVEYVNPAFVRMWAIDPELDLVGQLSKQVLEHSSHRFARPARASRHVLQVLDTHEISERFELDLQDGRILTQLSYPVTDAEDRPIGRLWIYEDVTHERQTAQQLAYLAEHDPLTGLHNRHRFQIELDRIINASLRRGSRFALIYFDLDDFKHINDHYGHGSGDTVLVRTAGELSSITRGGETFARLGGDEFAILTEVEDDETASRLAERLLLTIAAIPLRFRGSNLRLTASIGIAMFPTHGTQAEDLVARADAAMYQAKGRGKNTWALYNPEQNDSDMMLRRMSWSRRIAQALEQDQFELHFQGVYAAATGNLNHLEALVRMRDDKDPQQLLMPGQFIPVAEKTGQIREIDLWVMRQAVRHLAATSEQTRLAVNISARSVDDPALPQLIRELLEQYEVTPSRLLIELTETAAVTEVQDAQRLIEALHQIGCTVCLDDFGTGFATFAYLKYLAVRVLKVDGIFIRDLANAPENQVFVRAIVEVARGLGKQTVAEFVEDEPTLQMLRDLGVDFVQGYHLDRPAASHPGLQLRHPH